MVMPKSKGKLYVAFPNTVASSATNRLGETCMKILAYYGSLRLHVTDFYRCLGKKV